MDHQADVAGMSALGDAPGFAPVTADERTLICHWLGGSLLKERLWEWQYRANPGSAAPYVALRTSDAGLVGFNGLMPVRVKLSGQHVEAAWSCDFVVAPDHRGAGIGSKLKSLLAQRSPILMAFGISDLAVPVHKRAGWIATDTEVFELVRNRSGYTLRAALRRATQFTLEHVLGLVPVAEAPGEVMLSRIDSELASELGGLWLRGSGEWGNSIVRDAEYLRWRYADCPGIHYDALQLRDASGTLQAALLIRAHHWESAIVDYIGLAKDRSIKARLVAEFVRRFHQARILQCRTSDLDFRRLLARKGFLQSKSIASRFHVAAPAKLHDHIRKTWSIYGGDSDGEFLAAAAKFPQVEIREWSEQEFLDGEQQWQRLLGESTAHRLFMNWHWQSLWWRYFGKPNGCRLRLLAAYDRMGDLVGLAPFVFDRVRVGRSGFPTRRLRFLGSIWGGSMGMRTEYQAFVTRSGQEAGVVASVLVHLAAAGGWDDLVISDIDADSEMHRALHRYAPGIGYLRSLQSERDVSYQVNTAGSFDDYKAQLSASTRRRLFGARERLIREHGPVRIEYADHRQIREYVDQLNELHAQRWGKPAFEHWKLEFNLDIAEWLAQHGGLQLSRLVVEGRVRSVLLNLRYGRSEINLQSGFDESFGNKIPLGYVHLGYAIEACFEEPVDTLDLLAGWGKGSNYKKAFATDEHVLTANHLVRSPVRTLGYRLRDRVR